MTMKHVERIWLALAVVLYVVTWGYGRRPDYTPIWAPAAFALVAASFVIYSVYRRLMTRKARPNA